MRSWRVAAISFGVVLAACASAQDRMAEEGREPLGKTEVKNLMSGVTGYTTNSDGTDVVIYRAADGTVRGKATWTGGSETDKGQWRVRDDGAMCTEWNNWLNGQEGCWKLYDTGDSIIFANVSGPGEDYNVPKSDIRQGNIEGL